MSEPYLATGAHLSIDGVFRYRLNRRWGETERALTFIMLNPSTADVRLDDPTIRRCVGFAKREGLDGLAVVNLCAFRSPKPEKLLAVADPIGEMNPVVIEQAFLLADKHDTPVIAAWGSWGVKRFAAQIERIKELAEAWDRPLHCLGTTKEGHPRHPLYVPKNQPLEVWP